MHVTFFFFFVVFQFLNKVLYAREGAKSMIDRTFVDLPWQVRLEVDGAEIDIPEV
jgi:diacylglycerol kinase (ATP)